ncbi:MAG: hypothetical protein GX617_11740 [Lentisphaerae bacterium]|nr:hypothetical protein [Lentisphaerota bacterium]
MGKNCDRCSRDRYGVSIMSMYNTEMICASCKAAELKRPDYLWVALLSVVYTNRSMAPSTPIIRWWCPSCCG